MEKKLLESLQIATRLSCLAYSDPEEIHRVLVKGGFTSIKWIDNKDTDTQLFMCCDNTGRLFVIVRGSAGIADWVTNFDFAFDEFAVWGEVHQGFFKDGMSVYHDVLSYIQGIASIRDIIVAGHSQGAAVATIIAMQLATDWEFSLLVPVASPRVCSKEAAKKFGRLHGKKTHLLVNNNDVVTRVPLRSMGYAHIVKAHRHYFKETGEYVLDILFINELFDMFHGRVADFGEIGTDGIKDHYPELYVDLINSVVADVPGRKNG